MKATLQLDLSVDIVGNRLLNVWIKGRQTGERIFTEQIGRLARGLDRDRALVIFPEGGNWTPPPVAPRNPATGEPGAFGSCRTGPGTCQPPPPRAPAGPSPPSPSAPMPT